MEICDLKVRVEGLEIWGGLGFSLEEILEGVEGREVDERVKGLVVDVELVTGKDGLVYDEIEAVLVLRIDDDDRLDE